MRQRRLAIETSGESPDADAAKVRVLSMTVDARSRHCGEAYDRLLRQERLILDVTEALAGALEDSGATRAELARRLGRTPGFVSQVLGGSRNLTLRTIADIATALSLEPSFSLADATASDRHPRPPRRPARRGDAAEADGARDAGLPH